MKIPGWPRFLTVLSMQLQSVNNEPTYCHKFGLKCINGMAEGVQGIFNQRNRGGRQMNVRVFRLLPTCINLLEDEPLGSLNGIFYR